MEEEKVEEKTNSPNEILKDQDLITEAASECSKLDIIICGLCQKVFHFIEEFQEHKNESCSPIKSDSKLESKRSTWGYILWKQKQVQDLKEDESPLSAWEYYKRWLDLDDAGKEIWCLAGESVQHKNKFASAVVLKDEHDPLSFESKSSMNDSFNSSSSTNGSMSNTNRAIRNAKDEEKAEYVVEKLMGKRYHPKRKTFEYLVKWEAFDEEQTTWEAVANLNCCKDMLEAFEEDLKRKKLEKAKLNTPTRGRGRGRGAGRSPAVRSSFLADVTPGDRPQRMSKQKALSQVKTWCGNISDTDEAGLKRSYEDDDSDDSFEKKMKYDDYSDDSDSDIHGGNLALKRVAKPTILNNGIGKKFPQNVLIPDANGVVRINQKQLPSLSTGVYIMSKTAGIIKLDSSTSKVATSGGQTIVKVAPKIGQTQIKIVKKDGGTSKIIQIPKTTTTSTTIQKPKPPIKIKKEDDPASPNTVIKTESKVVTQKKPTPGDESDDGIEPLEFPKDLPIPAPDSPPSDFVLDPFTGKIVGQDYPEKPVESEKPEDSLNDGTTSLENIVKIAAADITEADLNVEPMPMIETKQETQTSTTEELEATLIGLPVATATTSEIVKETPPETTLLNKALTKTLSSPVQQKQIVARPKLPPKIINQSVAPSKNALLNPMIRTSNNANIVRTKPVAPKPKFNIANNSPKNVYPKTTNNQQVQQRRINYVYKAANQTSPQKRVVQNVQTTSNVHRITTPKKDPVTYGVQTTPAKKKTVISMPSLIGDDESMQVEQVPVVSEVATTAIEDTATTSPTVSQTANISDAELSSFTLTDNENPIFVTGDDGTLYQVAGQNEQGQTILITQGSDGQQQCLLVTNEIAQEEPIQAGAVEVAAEAKPIEEPLTVKTEAEPADHQVVAQVVRAEPLSPGGTHKVVVMLPDGNLVVTKVSPEEYASLELE